MDSVFQIKMKNEKKKGKKNEIPLWLHGFSLIGSDTTESSGIYQLHWTH